MRPGEWTDVRTGRVLGKPQNSSKDFYERNVRSRRFQWTKRNQREEDEVWTKEPHLMCGKSYLRAVVLLIDGEEVHNELERHLFRALTTSSDSRGGEKIEEAIN